MRKLLMVFFLGSIVVFAAAVLIQIGPTQQFHVSAQNPSPNPANEHNCPSARGGAEAIPAQIGSGTANFSRNQSLCLPQLAPVPTGLSPLAFIVQGVEPGDRVDSQGTIYVVSIRGVPGGVDLWRWDQTLDGAPNTALGITGTLPFRYEGQPDNCGIFALSPVPGMGGCANNVGDPSNLGIAPGGGDADIAVNTPDPTNSNIPNLPLTSLTLAPGVTATHSTNRGDSFSPPNVVAAAIPLDDRQWNDAIDPKTAYLVYHDIATFNIEVHRSNNGGLTYTNGLGEAIDLATFPAAGGVPATNSANLLGQIRIDHSSCPSRGNLYQIFVAPDSVSENMNGGSLRSVYVGVSKDAKLGLPAFMFTDHKIFASPSSSPGGKNGTANIFPALATDNLGFVYAVWSDNTNIFFSSSSDHGTTWTTPTQVNSGATVGGKSNVFPWVAADANGHVVVVWLGETNIGTPSAPANSNSRSMLEPTCTGVDAGTNRCWAQWKVYMVETVNGHATVPSFTQFTASDHVIHRGTVSTGGLGGQADRNLADFFQVALDPQHRANIAFADDHIVSPLSKRRTGTDNPDDPKSFRVGVPYFTRQLGANPNIVTDGDCAGTPQEVEEEDQGDGEDNDHDHASFVDKKQPTDNGTLVYNDPSQNLNLQSSNGVQGISYSGSCVSFSGNAKVNGQLGYQFNFSACDLSALGTGIGNFSISVTGPLGFAYQKSGTFTSGFVKLRVRL